MQEVRHYGDVNIELIRRAVNGFDWKQTFLETIVNEKVDFLNRIILNILSSLIPHEHVVCDDNVPPCFNKAPIFQENNAEKYWNNRDNLDLKDCLRYLQACLNGSIEAGKKKCYRKIVKKSNNTQKNSEVVIHFLLMSDILLTNACLHLHFQQKILEKLLKISIQIKPMDLIT